MKLVTDVITISAAATAQTAKIQFHEFDILTRFKVIDFLSPAMANTAIIKTSVVLPEHYFGGLCRALPDKAI